MLPVLTVICPVLELTSNLPASVPVSEYVSVSPSGSVAATAAPMLVPAAEFSAMLRVVDVPSSKVGFSFTSVTLMVTGMV